MKLSISFHKPLGHLNGMLDFSKKPEDFSKQFELSDLKLSDLSVADFFGLAIDAGYGVLNSTDQTRFLAMSSSVRQRLGSYLRARLKILWMLLRVDVCTGRIKIDEIADYLDSTEKGDAAFILGSLASRHATKLWLELAGLHLVRFWHFSVYSACSVSRHSFSDISLAGKSRPDFIAQDNRGSWYSVEAKGSFNGLNLGTLRDGLNQARVLKTISYWDAGTSRLLINHVGEYACSLAHFRKNGRLHITHLDPPSSMEANRAEGAEENSSSIDLVYELAELSHFYQACLQFRQVGLPGRADDQWRPRDTGLLRWRVLFNNNKDDLEVWIAAPEKLLNKEFQLRDVLFAMDYIAPILAEQLQSSGTAMAAVEPVSWREALVKRINEELILTDGRKITSRQRDLVRRIISELEDEDLDTTPIDWHSAMQVFLDLPVIDFARERYSIRSLLYDLWGVPAAAFAAELDAILPRQDRDVVRMDLYRTAHGLLVASRRTNSD